MAVLELYHYICLDFYIKLKTHHPPSHTSPPPHLPPSSQPSQSPSPQKTAHSSPTPDNTLALSPPHHQSGQKALPKYQSKPASTMSPPLSLSFPRRRESSSLKTYKLKSYPTTSS